MMREAAEHERLASHLHDFTGRVQAISYDVAYPNVAAVTMDAGEVFNVYQPPLLTLLEVALSQARAVAIRSKRPTQRWRRYITEARLLPRGDEPTYPCVRCGALTTRRDRDGVYPCDSCHNVMRP